MITPKSLFHSPRRFEIWRYLVSHGQLLLRSVPTESASSRIEVLFKGVYAIKTNTSLEGLAIREPSSAESSKIDSEVGLSLRDLGLIAFVIESASGTGYIVASSLNSVEDDGDYKAPSALLIGN